MENMEKKSFEFIRELVIAERYKKFKKEIWNGADVIFVTSNITIIPSARLKKFAVKE